MGTKLNPGKFDCYENALPDEPMFILLARDINAPELVEAWVSGRLYDMSIGKKPKSDMEVVEEAQECAKKMRQWRKQNMFAWRK